MPGNKPTMASANYKLFARPFFRYSEVDEVAYALHTVFDVQRTTLPDQFLYIILSKTKGSCIVGYTNVVWYGTSSNTNLLTER